MLRQARICSARKDPQPWRRARAAHRDWPQPNLDDGRADHGCRQCARHLVRRGHDGRQGCHERFCVAAEMLVGEAGCLPPHQETKRLGQLLRLRQDRAVDENVEKVGPLSFMDQSDVIGEALQVTGCDQSLEARILHVPEQWDSTDALSIRCPHSKQSPNPTAAARLQSKLSFVKRKNNINQNSNCIPLFLELRIIVQDFRGGGGCNSLDIGQ